MAALWQALVFLACVLPALVWSAAPSSPLVLDTRLERIDLSEQLSLLRDPGRHLSFSDVKERLNDFTRASREQLITTFNPDVYWFRMTLRNASAQPMERWLVVGNPKTQRVSLYLGQDEGWQISDSGRSVAALARPIATPAPVFPLTLQPGQTINVVLRVDSRGATDMMTTLWQPAAYVQSTTAKTFHFALLLGGLLVAASLSLIAFARLREKQYLWFGLLLIGVAGLEASRENLLSTYLWPAHLTLPSESLVFFASLGLFASMEVASHALALAQRQPGAERLLKALRWGVVLSALLALFSYGHGVRLLSLLSVLVHFIMLFLSLHAWRSDRRNSPLFLFGFSLALLTETARQMANLKLLPWISAMNFSMAFYLLASPLILVGLIDQTRRLRERLHYSETVQQAKSSFLSQISHELRSPLNTILGYSRMLSRGTNSLPLTEGSAGIEKNALSLLRLIDELLDEARASAGKLSISPAPFNVQAWLDEMTQAAQLVIEEQGNRFIVESHGELPETILGDASRLRQVLDNLLSNANRHTHHGIVRLRVESLALSKEAQLTFSVIDDGEGVPAESIEMLFEPFVRLDTIKRGHGLGLPICRDLIRQMGGDICIQSTYGSGSQVSFCLTFPLSGEHPALGAGEPPPLPSDRPRILLVDDDPIHLDNRANQLKAGGFAVRTALGGNSGLNLIEATEWDLVVVDQDMPEVDGWAFLREIRRLPSQLPVILLSAALPNPPADFPSTMRFDVVLDKFITEHRFVARVWHRVLNLDPNAPEPNWSALAQLSCDGDVSGISDWIDAYRQTTVDGATRLNWVEQALHRLNFALLETIGGRAAK